VECFGFLVIGHSEADVIDDHVSPPLRGTLAERGESVKTRRRSAFERSRYLPGALRALLRCTPDAEVISLHTALVREPCALTSTPARCISLRRAFPAASRNGTSASFTRIDAGAAPSEMLRQERRNSSTHSPCSLPSSLMVHVAPRFCALIRNMSLRSAT